jgi:hypothetical protein
MNDLTVLSLNPCAEVMAHLDAFVDNEVPGQVRLRIAEHLDTCASCASEVEALSSVGDVLRASMLPETVIDLRLSGLGPRVVGRVRAEERLSWGRLFARALDGWHWTIVGAGSVIGTFVTTTLLSMILTFGPTPAREDSLSALLGNLGSPPGYLFIEVSPVDSDQVTELLQVQNGKPTASRLVTALASSSQSPVRSEAEVVEELAATVTRDGRVLSLAAMDRPTRERAEALFTEIANINSRRRVPAIERTLSVRGVRLVTSVTAKS